MEYMKKEPTITVNADGTTTFGHFVSGFPVDGDRIAVRGGSHNKHLVQRATRELNASTHLQKAARTWLGAPMAGPGPELDLPRVAILVNRLYPGGIGKFVAIEAFA